MKSKKTKWSGQSRGGYYGHLFFISLIKLCGVRAAYFFLFFIVPYFIIFSPKSTSAIWKYNRHILKYGYIKSSFKLFVHLYTFGQTIIDKIAINGGLKSFYSFDFDNYDAFLSKLNSNKGVIMIGAHLGCWEIGSSFFGDYGKKINIVMYNNESKKVQNALSNNDNNRIFNIIDINQDGISLIISIKKALDNAEYLCFQGDRYIREESVLEHTFMGQTAYFPKGVFDIAAKFNVPIVFYWAVKTRSNKYKSCTE